MERRTDRSLAFDLLDTDLTDAASLTELVVAHTIAPVRAIYGLPAPRPGEGTSFLTMERYEGEITIEVHRPFTMEESAAVFDPIARALLLFAWLFPGSVLSHNRVERILAEPGPAVLRGPDQLLLHSHELVAELSAGLLGDITTHVDWPGVYPHRPARNDEAMTELARAQALVAAALDPIPNQEPFPQLIDVGLDRISWWRTREIDEVLRSLVHRRLIWFGTLEPTIHFDDDGEPSFGGPMLAMDRGVFPADVPESLLALVLLDLTEQLGHGRGTGRCGQCGRLMVLNARQDGRARRGEPVYHPECRDEHRLTYFRRKSRDRYARTKSS